MQNEMLLLGWFGTFLERGRFIYDFQPDLIEVLAKAPLGDVAVGDLKMLEGTIYFHYGPIAELFIDGVQYEGAYVSWLPKRQLLSIVALEAGALSSKPVRSISADRGEVLPIFMNNLNESLTSAITNTRTELIKKDRVAKAQVAQMMAQLGKQYGEVMYDKTQFEDMEWAKTAAMHEPFTRLVLGTYAFLTTYPEDAVVTWPSDTPAARWEKVNKPANIAKAAIAQKVLDNEGYMRLRYVGLKFVNEHLPTPGVGHTGEGTGRKLVTHPRTFFWRNQAWGPKLSLRRPTLVRATIVNPGSGLPAGRVYDVES
jgi:hypothetical protein